MFWRLYPNFGHGTHHIYIVLHVVVFNESSFLCLVFHIYAVIWNRYVFIHTYSIYIFTFCLQIWFCGVLSQSWQQIFLTRPHHRRLFCRCPELRKWRGPFPIVTMLVRIQMLKSAWRQLFHLRDLHSGPLVSLVLYRPHTWTPPFCGQNMLHFT